MVALERLLDTNEEIIDVAHDGEGHNAEGVDR